MALALVGSIPSDLGLAAVEVGSRASGIEKWIWAGGKSSIGRGFGAVECVGIQCSTWGLCCGPSSPGHWWRGIRRWSLDTLLRGLRQAGGKMPKFGRFGRASKESLRSPLCGMQCLEPLVFRP